MKLCLVMMTSKSDMSQSLIEEIATARVSRRISWSEIQNQIVKCFGSVKKVLKV